MSGSRAKGLARCCASLILLLTLWNSGCKKEESPREIKPLETAAAETDIQLARLAGDLLSVQERIRELPGDQHLRTRLLELAVQPTTGKLRTAGIGKIAVNAPNPALEMQNVERAAFIDGCRWLIYIRAWQKNITSPDFGRIQGNLPAATIIYRHASPGQVVVMVETDVQ